MMATSASGPILSCLEVPSSEYIMVLIIAVYNCYADNTKPNTGGTLTRACAYERDWGMIRNDIVKPAIKSSDRSANLYLGNQPIYIN
jgi:hypothetical protein